MLQIYHAVKHLPTLLTVLLLEPLPHSSFFFFTLIQICGLNSQSTYSCIVEPSKIFVLSSDVSVLASSPEVSSHCTKISNPLSGLHFWGHTLCVLMFHCEISVCLISSTKHWMPTDSGQMKTSRGWDDALVSTAALVILCRCNPLSFESVDFPPQCQWMLF